MKRTKAMTLATILLAGVVIVGSNASAESVMIPVSGSDTTTVIDPGVVWTDSDGVTHYRGMIMIGDLVGQDVDGTPILGESTYVINMNINMATGAGDFTAQGRVANCTYGELTGVWEGRLQATITAFVYDGTYNYPRNSGDFEGWKDRGTWTGIMGSGSITWDGAIHIPDGGGGAKAAASETLTFSAVKDLYR